VLNEQDLSHRITKVLAGGSFDEIVSRRLRQIQELLQQKESPKSRSPEIKIH